MSRHVKDGIDLDTAGFESLYDLFARPAVRDSLDLALSEVLLAAISLVGADAGYIRLFELEDSGPLLSRFPIVASQGISETYIDYISNLPKPISPRPGQQSSRVSARSLKTRRPIRPLCARPGTG